MRILRSIVAPSTALMAFGESKLTGCSPIRTQVIGDELVWDKVIFLQKLAHQFELAGMDASGQVVLKRRMRRSSLERFTKGLRY